VDLRKVTEFPPAEVADLKEKGVKRVSLPVTAGTWSEQDMDALRREFLRGESPVAVVSAGGERAALVVLQHVARAEKLSVEQALQRWPEIKLPSELQRLLASYLERHPRTL
jgi:protein tyrosine phosphatase (PTP) superfamily phosphohydrolase (DUF442 family)